jgi:hypothetical protein
MKYEKPIMFVTGVAAQFWQLFVIMTVWNMFASSYHVFTFGEIIWAQLFVQGLSLTQNRIIKLAYESRRIKEVVLDFTENVTASGAIFLLFGGVLLVAYVVKYFQ